MTELIPSGASDVLDPKPFSALAGDHKDDDGQALDDYFTPNPGGPVEYGTVLNHDAPTIPQTNRILSRMFTMSAGNDPVQFYPADPLRETLQIHVVGGNLSNCGVKFGSDKSDVQGIAATLVGGGAGASVIMQVYEFRGYTGAVWINCVVGTNVQVNVFSVTK